MILAKSIKYGKRCIAGKDINSGDWHRLGIPDRDDPYAFNQADLTKYVGNAGGPNVLEKYRIPLLSMAPKNHHPEDWIIDSRHSWQMVGQFNRNDLHALRDNPPYELLQRSPNHTDYILASDVVTTPLTSSLHLVKIEPLNAAKIVYISGKFGKYKPRFEFEFNSQNFSFAITDPNIPMSKTHIPERNFANGFVVFGLAEEYIPDGSSEKRHYKLALTLL